VGDSRIYRLRGNSFKQLTHDHTELQQYIENGQLTKEEAARHHLRHILSQAIGGKSNSFRRAFTSGIAIEPGDLFLICSDGLYDMTGDTATAEILRQGDSLEQSADLLRNKALKNGGEDNITMILIRAER
jgi:protein phosphatase